MLAKPHGALRNLSVGLAIARIGVSLSVAGDPEDAKVARRLADAILGSLFGPDVQMTLEVFFRENADSDPVMREAMRLVEQDPRTRQLLNRQGEVLARGIRDYFQALSRRSGRVERHPFETLRSDVLTWRPSSARRKYTEGEADAAATRDLRGSRTGPEWTEWLSNPLHRNQLRRLTNQYRESEFPGVSRGGTARGADAEAFQQWFSKRWNQAQQEAHRIQMLSSIEAGGSFWVDGEFMSIPLTNADLPDLASPTWERYGTLRGVFGHLEIPRPADFTVKSPAQRHHDYLFGLFRAPLPKGDPPKLRSQAEAIAWLKKPLPTEAAYWEQRQARRPRGATESLSWLEYLCLASDPGFLDRQLRAQAARLPSIFEFKTNLYSRVYSESTAAQQPTRASADAANDRPTPLDEQNALKRRTLYAVAPSDGETVPEHFRVPSGAPLEGPMVPVEVGAPSRDAPLLVRGTEPQTSRNGRFEVPLPDGFEITGAAFFDRYGVPVEMEILRDPLTGCLSARPKVPEGAAALVRGEFSYRRSRTPAPVVRIPATNLALMVQAAQDARLLPLARELGKLRGSPTLSEVAEAISRSGRYAYDAKPQGGLKEVPRGPLARFSGFADSRGRICAQCIQFAHLGKDLLAIGLQGTEYTPYIETSLTTFRGHASALGHARLGVVGKGGARAVVDPTASSIAGSWYERLSVGLQARMDWLKDRFKRRVTTPEVAPPQPKPRALDQEVADSLRRFEELASNETTRDRVRSEVASELSKMKQTLFEALKKGGKLPSDPTDPRRAVYTAITDLLAIAEGTQPTTRLDEVASRLSRYQDFLNAPARGQATETTALAPNTPLGQALRSTLSQALGAAARLAPPIPRSEASDCLLRVAGAAARRP